MRTVIGLFPSKREVNNEIKLLEDSGYDSDNIRVLTENWSVKKTLCCEPNRVVAKYASWGAILGIAVFGVFISVAVWCDCLLYPITQTIALGIILIGILVGAFIGGFIGVFVGLAEYEKDVHLYTQGIRVGDKVFVLKTEVGEGDKAISVLRQIGCIGVRMLPESKEPA